MTALAQLDPPWPPATDGEIAAINLESARRRAWARFEQDARAPGVAEAVVDQERLAAQFLADTHTDRAVKVMVSTLFKTGLESLKSRFGVPK